MTAIRLALLELRRFRGPLRRLVPVALCLIPLLYGAMYLWANWDPYGKLKQIPVAVVNHDRVAHSKQGQRVDAGNQFVQQLKVAGTFDWHFVDDHEARDGLEHGRYYFTITVPEDLSGKLATAANTQPEQASITIQLNDANNYVIGVMSEAVQPELQDQVNSAAHAAYVRAIYGELSQVRDKLGVASDGAHRLVDATATAQQGTRALSSGTSALRSGTAQLAEGARQISQATSTLDNAVSKAATAVADKLPGAAATLVTAANLTAQGLSALHTGTSQVKQGTARAVTDLNQLGDAAPQLRGNPVYQRAVHDAEQVDALAGQIDGQAAAADANAQQVLSEARQLQANVGDARQGVLAATAPVRLIDAGARDVSGGAATLSQATDAADQGAQSLKSAADQAHSGAAEIAGTVDDGLRQIPATSPDEVSHAAEVLGTPVRIYRDNLNPAGVYGRGFAPFFFGIALWVFGLFAYLLLRPVNLRALASRISPLTVAVAGWLPAAVLGVAGALLLFTVVDLGLGLDPVNPVLTVALLALGAATFVAVDHFLRTTLGAPGDVLSLVLLILQLTSSGGLYPMPTTPGLFQVLNPVLPMTYLIDGLRITTSGGLTANLVRDFLVLAGVLVLFLGLTSLTVRRQRMWTPARLHPDVEL
ncbi:YhgE/Pip domain-containing protein [Kutzneria viridogrisea]|uniref:Membrane protein n=1 Tax=Kutzneria viridogrisea TaxID=47990 RepID=A0ABR6BC13_9PSEU|nr:putative membrane protein [Kutzneria viridogrisea]